MAKRILWVSVLCLGVFSGAKVWMAAQQDKPDTVFRVNVNMVQLDVAVTDKKGNYITGLSPWDFEIYEDGIAQKMATFGEENEAPRRLEDYPRRNAAAVGEDPPTKTGRQAHEWHIQPLLRKESPDRVASMVVGASVFILFDTSNYMYRGFVFAQDAIAEFVRSLDHPYRVAFYSYSRNFSRVCMLTPDRSVALSGVRETVAGDDAALYDALLMTLKDASRYSGRRVIVAFSNGPDNSSMVAPEDVRELAQTEGIPIYMISTHVVSAVNAINEEQKGILPWKIEPGPNLRGKKFAVWGLSFKPKTDDMREAPSIVVIEDLLKSDSAISAFDPVAMENAKKIFEKRISYAKDTLCRFERWRYIVLSY